MPGGYRPGVGWAAGGRAARRFYTEEHRHALHYFRLGRRGRGVTNGLQLPLEE